MESVQFQKIKGARLHPFPLSFSFFFLFLLQTTNYLSTFYLPIYVSFICVSFVTQTNTAFFISFLCFAWFLRFVALCGFIFAFGASLVSFYFLLNRPTPPPFHGTESVATPFLNFFIFSFSKFFC